MGVQVNFLDGGLNRQTEDADRFGAIIGQVAALPTNWAEEEIRSYTRVQDLVDDGVSATATANDHKAIFWHATEFFRLGERFGVPVVLYIMLTTEATATFGQGADGLSMMAKFRENAPLVRNFAVYCDDTLTTTLAGGWNTTLEQYAATHKIYARAILTYDGAQALDFSGETNDRIQVDVSRDGTTGGLADTITTATVLLGAAGTMLGQWCAIGVHQRPSWRDLPVNGIDPFTGEQRWAELELTDGTSVEQYSQTQLDALANNGVVLIAREAGADGAYISTSRTARGGGSDYSFIEIGRTIDKVATLVQQRAIRFIDAPIYAVGDTILASTARFIEREVRQAISRGMVDNKTGNALELVLDPVSNQLPLDTVLVDTNQNVGQTNTLTIQVRVRPVLAASNIIINIGVTSAQI